MEAPKAPPKEQVEVTYNGEVAEFRDNPHEAVQALLSQSIAHFHISANQHILSLFNSAGKELDDKESLADAGVNAGDLLVLRQSIVKGG